MRAIRILLLLLLPLSLPAQKPDKFAVVNSRHDFRPTSTATIRAAASPNPDSQLCVYCHTPHNSNPGPLTWNQELGTTNFPTYTSSTMQSTVPTTMTTEDSSKLCLSCHDGTVALGNTIRNGQIPFLQGAAYQLPATSPSNLAGYNGMGYSDDHPFAFQPNYNNPAIKTPDPTDSVKLVNGMIQCSSCHDPHNENTDSVQQSFLVKINAKSAICLSCHQQAGWSNSAHNLPPNATEDSKYTSLQGAHTGYTGVSNNGCESCHKPHAPAVNQRLLKFVEENTCYQCHDGSVTTLNLKAEFTSKTYMHPVPTTPSQHDDSESPNSPQVPMPEISPTASRHTECYDCHNSHYSQPNSSVLSSLPPQVTPPLLGVKGQSTTNSFLLQSTNQYEVCFKCHGDSANKPQTQDVSTTGTGFGRNPKRQFDFAGATPLPTRDNTRLQFTSAISSHPVTQAGNLSTGLGGEVPSLRPYILDNSGQNILSRSLNSASQIFCTDCHNSDTGRNLGPASVGPAGPHGSNIVHLLERAYAYDTPPVTPGGSTAGISYSASTYSLCDKCHDIQNSILHDQSFIHNEHVQGVQASCATCHDAHSSSSPMLVNFDTSIVGPSSTGALQYTRTGLHHGTCTLTCHGQSHIGESY